MIKHPGCIMVTVTSFVLSGCGGLEVRNEANFYHKEQDKQASETLAQCIAGVQTSMSQNRAGRAPDCFDLVVKQSPKRIGPVVTAAPGARDGDKRVPPESDDAYAYIDQFGLMALFSKMVYHRFQEPQLRSSAGACEDQYEKHPLHSLYAPASRNGRWRLWDNGRKGCHVEGGLFMETYVYFPPGRDRNDDSFTRAVIVFRGTENGQTQRTADWSANLSMAFGFEPKQYVAASRQVDKIVDELRASHPGGLPIYAAGHSLGGGLAQMAAYWNKNVDAAYAFNSTPVTGWTWIHEERRTSGALDRMNGDPTIYRISQRSEALHALRAISTAVNSDRFGRSDFNFDFRIEPVAGNASTSAKLIAATSQHDIGLLACHMAARVVLGHAGQGGAAAFDYTADMALRALTQQDKLDADSQGSESLCSHRNLEAVRNAVCSAANRTPLCLAELATARVD